MKALWFLPFTFAAGAEGFALFAPYLVGVLSLLYFARMHRPARRAALALEPARGETMSLPSDVQPAL